MTSDRPAITAGLQGAFIVDQTAAKLGWGGEGAPLEWMAAEIVRLREWQEHHHQQHHKDSHVLRRA